MTEKKNEQIAVFRFGVIHEFVGGARLSADEKRRLLHDKCCRKWIIPHCSRSRISENTIYRWIRRYENSGGDIKSLYPEKRADHGKLRGIDEETAAHIVQARRQKPHLPVFRRRICFEDEPEVGQAAQDQRRLFRQKARFDRNPDVQA